MNKIEQIMKIFLYATLIGGLFAGVSFLKIWENKPHTEIIQHHVIPVPVPVPTPEPKIENYHDKMTKEKIWI